MNTKKYFEFQTMIINTILINKIITKIILQEFVLIIW